MEAGREMATVALLIFLGVDFVAVSFALYHLHKRRIESDRTDARYRIRYR
jgi:hypothetical protein